MDDSKAFTRVAEPGSAVATSGPSFVGLIGLLVAFLLLLAPIAFAAAQEVSGGRAGADLTGAVGHGSSYNNSAILIGSVTAPNAMGSSESHPLLVEKDGFVSWFGTTTSVITNHHWQVSLYGIEVKSGGSKNLGHKVTASGKEHVSDYLKVSAPGLYHVTGSLSGDGGKVDGDIWLKVSGSPVGTPVWLLGLALFLGGIVAAFFARPSIPAPAPAAVGTTPAPTPPAEEA